MIFPEPMNLIYTKYGHSQKNQPEGKLRTAIDKKIIIVIKQNYKKSKFLE